MIAYFEFTEEEKNKVIRQFGKAFYEGIMRNLHRVVNEWELSSLTLVDSYSASLVFMVESEKFGPAVLKFGSNQKELRQERIALAIDEGRNFCKLYASDLDNSILLEERFVPGTVLRDETSVEKRLTVYCQLYKGLHVDIEDVKGYTTYTKWVTRITEYMSRLQEYQLLNAYMQQAEKIYLALTRRYSRTALLHGDFHHDNILLTDSGDYKLIDPKGIIGDPVFDIARFILNEFCFEEDIYSMKEHVMLVIDGIGQSLNIPCSVIRQCLFVETTMASCWWVESGVNQDGFERILLMTKFAEDILNEVE